MEMILVCFDKYLQSVLLNYPVPNTLNKSGGLLDKLMFIQSIEAEYHNKAFAKIDELLNNGKINLDKKDLKNRLLVTIDQTFTKFKAGTLN